MAIQIVQKDIEAQVRKRIAEVCGKRPKKSQYNEDPAIIYCLLETEDILRIPVGVWNYFFDSNPNLEFEFERREFACTKTLFTADTDPKKYRDQDVIFEEATTRLETFGSVFLALPTGFGKTTMGNVLSAWSKCKTVVLCHLETVRNQWVEEFQNHSTAKVQHVKGQKLDPNADVYVMGVLKAGNFSPEVFDQIGMVIFDEAHISSVTAFSVSLLNFTPKYLVGLSATPKRSDGMHILFSLYFGDPRSFIVRKEVKPFTIYKIETDFEPKVEYRTYKGKYVIDWVGVVSSLASNRKRADFIITLLEREPNRKMMILGNRKDWCTYVHNSLISKGIRSARLIDRDQVPDPSSYDVLVAGTKKAGVGFNDPSLEGLILASDCMEVQQYEGRIRATGCVIYDIVDCHPTLEKHWNNRKKWYLQRGATVIEEGRKSFIQTKKREIPNFFE